MGNIVMTWFSKETKSDEEQIGTHLGFVSFYCGVNWVTYWWHDFRVIQDRVGLWCHWINEKSSRYINFGIFYRKSISKIKTEEFKGSWIETLFLNIAVPFDVEKRQEDKNIHGTSNGKIIFLFENVDFLRFLNNISVKYIY